MMYFEQVEGVKYDELAGTNYSQNYVMDKYLKLTKIRQCGSDFLATKRNHL